MISASSSYRPCSALTTFNLCLSSARNEPKLLITRIFLFSSCRLILLTNGLALFLIGSVSALSIPERSTIILRRQDRCVDKLSFKGSNCCWAWNSLSLLIVRIRWPISRIALSRFRLSLSYPFKICRMRRGFSGTAFSFTSFALTPARSRKAAYRFPWYAAQAQPSLGHGPSTIDDKSLLWPCDGVMLPAPRLSAGWLLKFSGIEQYHAYWWPLVSKYCAYSIVCPSWCLIKSSGCPCGMIFIILDEPCFIYLPSPAVSTRTFTKCQNFSP